MRCAGPDRPKWLGPLSEGSVPSYLNGEYAGALPRHALPVLLHHLDQVLPVSDWRARSFLS